MKQIAVAFLLAVGCLSVSAQKKLAKKDLYGTWVISRTEMNGIVHDFEKDTTYFTGDAGPGFKSAEDSTSTMEMLRMIFDKMKDGKLYFDAKGIYKEIDPDGSSKPGTYTFSETASLITTVMKSKSGKARTNKLKVVQEGSLVRFTDITKGKSEIILLMKKQG